MPQFDEKKAYAAQEETYFDDGREIELLHFVYSRPNIEEIRGNPSKVLAAIDEYGRTKKYLMNVGEDKGKIVTDLITEKKPKVMVELGGYVGYSCIYFGEALRKVGGTRYFSLEKSPEFGAVIASLVDLAGLSDLIKVIIGDSCTSLKRLQSSGQLQQIDLLFLDHIKPMYLPDLKLCEQLGLVGMGTWMAADNVIKPGNPPYLKYVRSSVEEKFKGTGEESKTSEGEVVKGKPELKYESYMIESFEPTGVPDGIEVTKCVGVEQSVKGGQ